MRPRPTAPGLWDVAASTFVAFNLALGQPLLDLLGRNAEFFVARDSARVDIVLLALLLTVGLPALVVGLIALVRRFHQVGGGVLHALTLTFLVVVAVLVILNRAARWPGALLVVIAAAVSLVATGAFYRNEGVRSVVRIAAVVPVVVAGLFLFVSPASKLVFASASGVSGGPVERPAPVVMVVFDELPIASLMDRSGAIDDKMFPNFARLARDGTWFRNATTVHSYTTHAVPTLLDGQYRQGDLPTLSDHPQNLFSVLADEYDLKVAEPITQLCPEDACASAEVEETFGERWTSLSEDLGIVTMRMVVPDDLAEGLPPVGEAWGGFAQDATPAEAQQEDADEPGIYAALHHSDPRAIFDRFVRDIRGRSPRRLYFLHALIPHAPWKYLPTGQEYSETGRVPGDVRRGQVGRAWGSDEWLVVQGYQRHLLQTAFVDRLIGRLVKHLKRVGIYDRSLIVVTADHGIAFRPNAHKRTIARATIGDIAAIPLFIKRPGERSGRVDDRPAETVDVFPSIMDVLGVELQNDVDGVPLFGGDREPRSERVVLFDDRRLVFGTHGREKFEVVEDKFATFGSGPGGSIDVFAAAPGGMSELVARPAAAIPAAGSGGRVVIENLDLYDDVEPRGPFVPAMVSGRLPPGGPGARDPRLVAVALNGQVAAVTRTYDDPRGGVRFYAMLPPQLFRRGANDLELFLIEGSAASPRLLALEEEAA